MTTTTHNPCCPAHNAALDCDTYRRTHVVEAGSDCCTAWTETNPYGGWVPRGCPAGFSSECSSWTSTGPCRCLLATLPGASSRVSDGQARRLRELFAAELSQGPDVDVPVDDTTTEGE